MSTNPAFSSAFAFGAFTVRETSGTASVSDSSIFTVTVGDSGIWTVTVSDVAKVAVI